VKSTGALSIVRDTDGPWRWDEQAETFVNHGGDEYGHIGSETIVQEGAGIEQVQWYRELPAPEADRWYIDPSDIGTAGDPGTLAKLEALMKRPDEGDGHQQIRNISHVLEMILSGTGALDARRVRLLQVLINIVAVAADRGGRMRSDDGMPPELAALFGAMGGLGRRRPEGGGEDGQSGRRGPLMDLFAEIERGRDPQTGGRRPDHDGEGSRGNGHDRDARFRNPARG